MNMDLIDLNTRDVLYTLFGCILIVNIWAIPQITKLVKAIEDINRNIQKILNDCVK